MANGKKLGLITGDEVKFHEDPSRKDMILPQGMYYDDAFETLERLFRANETVEQLEPEKFPYRPNDVYVAVARVIQRIYGLTFSAGVSTFFGEEPPTFKSVPVSLNETVEVATGRIIIPELERAEIFIGTIRDRDLGEVGAITATMKRKDRAQVKEILAAIREELRTNSIYRGKALKVNRDGEIQFMDMRRFPTFDQIVYSDTAKAALEGAVLNRLRYRKELEAEGVPFKQSALLYGPFGTGKTSFGQLAARVAVENGITAVFADAGADVHELLRTARLYGPAMIFVEDIDTYASSGEDDVVTKLLDSFDGVTAKGGEVLVVMTTNHIERIHKGLLRPGRTDAAIEIAYLDRNGVEKLVRAHAGDKLADDMDFDAVFAAAERYTPSFIHDMVKRAKVHAIGRLQGKHTNYRLATEDLVGAAAELFGHYQLMAAAGEGQRKPTLDAVVEEKLLLAAQTGVHGAVLDRGGDALGELVVGELVS